MAILNRWFIGLGIAALGGLAIATNPGPEAHGRYAQGLASRYLQEDICNQDLPIVGRRFAADCQKLAASPEVQGQMQSLLVKSSDRQNFLFFSLYHTDLSLQDLVPGVPRDLVPPYQAQTLGVFGQFLVYQAGATPSGSDL